MSFLLFVSCPHSSLTPTPLLSLEVKHHFLRKKKAFCFCFLSQQAAFFCLFLFFIYLFLAALGLRCCVRAFSSCGKRGPLLVAVRGLLIAVAFLVVEHWL